MNILPRIKIKALRECANIFYCRSLKVCLESGAINKNNQITKHIALPVHIVHIG